MSEELEREIASLQAQLIEATKRADEAAKRADEATKRAEEATKLAEQADNHETPAETKLKRSTFLQYLDHLQTILVPSLTAEDKPSLPSSGPVADVCGNVHLRVLRRWGDFSYLHDRQFDDLVKALGEEQLFPSRGAVEALKSDLMLDWRIDEESIEDFIRAYAERPARRIVNRFDARRQPRRGTLARFRDHDADGPSQPSPDRIGDPAANWWGIRAAPDGPQTPVLVGEFKAAHRIPAKSFRAVLGTDHSFAETLFADYARCETMTVAKVLCQAYHCMIIGDLAYGYVASGDSMVFLAVPRDDPGTLFFHLLDEASRVPSPRRSHAAGLATLALLALEAEAAPAQ
ncbi:hypothetical protein B0T18DRAFT_424936 [Schizothecium vesticola]|uniref:Uncharacterized protein n=1 Tax=Schizothecium vesticola TaxID=314040 RepID=A0AA40FB73_9PEZI|nr:hypothetical protein B0T18DRAFT_424936 [Schizothecium vesticola]